MYILSVILECSILNCIFERRVLGYFGVSDGEQATKDESQSVRTDSSAKLLHWTDFDAFMGSQKSGPPIKV